MFDQHTLKQLATWEPPTDFGERECLIAVKKFIALIEQLPDLRTVLGDYSYKSYVPVYVYRPSDVLRKFSNNGENQSSYPCLLLYFHHYVQFAAVGRTSWSEYLRENATWSLRGFGGLDLDNLVEPSDGDSEPGMIRVMSALSQVHYEALTPEYLRKKAPAWFEPLQRSEGVWPWDRNFHLFFQFND